MNRILLALGIAVSAVSVAGAQTTKLKNVKIRGYVTAVTSPTSFDIEDYRITRAEGFSLDFDNTSPDVTFRPEDIRVGVELEIKGRLNEQTGEMTATGIRVDLEQFKSIRQTAIVSIAPRGITRTLEGWGGELKADGQTILITPRTQVLFRPTKREKKLPEFEPLSSLEQVTVGMAMTYEGRRDRESGHIRAERVEFSTNDLEDGEANLWKSLKTSVSAAQGLTPRELKIDRVGQFKLLPNAEVQAYVAAIGRSLIPPYQADLRDDDPRKIPFQFHVVIDKSANAFATPNGIVVVHSGLLDLLDNEAQLAAILGHEIAHATHEHSWRGQQFHKKKRFGLAIAGALAAASGQQALADVATLIEGAVRNGHQRSLENQSDRVGLEYMVRAGYDPREAPNVWKLMTKKYGLQTTNVFWSDHENQATRRSYLMNELKNNYQHLDYASMRTKADEYRRIRAAVAAEAAR